jgi:hypothetical protein
MKKNRFYIICPLLIISVLVIYMITIKYNDNEKLDRVVNTQKITNTNIEFDSLICEAINKGNKQAFKEALINRVLIEGDTKMFYYAYLMANKHHDWRACEYIYNFLIYEKNKGLTFNNIEYFSSDITTRKLAIYYLLKSYEYGNPNTSNEELKKIFPNENKIPSSEAFLAK